MQTYCINLRNLTIALVEIIMQTFYSISSCPFLKSKALLFPVFSTSSNYEIERLNLLFKVLDYAEWLCNSSFWRTDNYVWVSIGIKIWMTYIAARVGKAIVYIKT